MSEVNLQKLMEAGVHFGHQTRRWNPRMKPYIFTARNGVHIINLDVTLVSLHKAWEFVKEIAANGRQILFVGTKRQAQNILKESATSVEMPYVIYRWLGGMLTNFHTICSSIDRLEKMEATLNSEKSSTDLTKKELTKMGKEVVKLERYLGGIRDMKRLPGALFVIDSKMERIAITEARRLGIPVISVVDTNCDPEGIDMVIPGNDDAIKAIELYTAFVCDACQAGKREHETRARAAAKEKRREDEAEEEEVAKAKTEFVAPKKAATTAESSDASMKIE